MLRTFTAILTMEPIELGQVVDQRYYESITNENGLLSKQKNNIIYHETVTIEIKKFCLS